jgi:signal transduction histidine kinase
MTPTRKRVVPLIVVALVAALALAVWVVPGVVHARAQAPEPATPASDLAKPLHTVAQTAAPGVTGTFAHRDRRILVVVWMLLAAEAGLLATLIWRRRHQTLAIAVEPSLPKIIPSDEVLETRLYGSIFTTQHGRVEQMLRDFSRRLILAQEEERRRIASELHDHFSQQLALLAIDLQQLSINPPAAHDALLTALQDQWRRTTEIASDVHALSHRLHPSKLDALGLVPTIRAHCRDVSRQSLAVVFNDKDVPPEIRSNVALCCFRVVEEALRNAVHHSGAGEAQVSLRMVNKNLVLRVTDGGRGFDPDSVGSTGFGLIVMRERVQLVGGTLDISSAPDKGTTIEARIPRLLAVQTRQESPVAPPEKGASAEPRRINRAAS